MKLPITNRPVVVKMFRDFIKQGYAQSDLLVFRFVNGSATVIPIGVFCEKYHQQYDALCKEILKRQRRTTPREVLYVWGKENGDYDMGVLEQRAPFIISGVH